MSDFYLASHDEDSATHLAQAAIGPHSGAFTALSHEQDPGICHE